MSDSLFLGIDGGGTSCRARLCDAQGHTLGEGRSGSANVRLGLEKVYGSIMEATQQAVAEAGLQPSVLARTYAGFGLAGAVTDAARASVSSYKHPFAAVVVETDAHTACLGAHGGDDGGILIMGTGSCGVARVGGVFHTIGGWGFMVSDHASGAQIGLGSLRYALQAHEGIVPETALSRALMTHFRDSPADLLAWSEQAKPRDYAGFVPQVVDYAAQGDPLAADVLREAAADACVLIERLQALGALQVCLMGGLSEVIRGWLPQSVIPVLSETQGDAMDGAILLARQQLERKQ